MISTQVKTHVLTFRRTNEKLYLSEIQQRAVQDAWSQKKEPIILTDPETRENLKLFSYKDIESIEKVQRQVQGYQIYLRDSNIGSGKMKNGVEGTVVKIERRYISTEEVIETIYRFYGNSTWYDLSNFEAQELLSRKS